MGMLPYSTCSYFMHETMKTSYCEAKNKKSLNRPEMLLVGASAGFTASTLSFPLEVARKRLMVGALLGKCPPHMAAALSEVIREEGLRGLYRGWGATCLKVMPSSGITWMFYEAWKDVLLVEKRLWQKSPASCSFGGKCWDRFIIKIRRKVAPSLLVNVPRTHC
nr:probable mitochondrial adenine nucleotide transporter BTL1 [Populus alba]